MAEHITEDSIDHARNVDLVTILEDIQGILKTASDALSTCDELNQFLSIFPGELDGILKNIANNSLTEDSNADILLLKYYMFQFSEQFNHLTTCHTLLSDLLNVPSLFHDKAGTSVVKITGSDDSSLRTDYLKKIPVLLIHDDLIILDQMMHRLFESGYFQVFPFITVESALESLSADSYGMFLIAINLIQEKSSYIMNQIRERNLEILVFSIGVSGSDHPQISGMDYRINGELSEDSTIGEIIEMFLKGLQRLSTGPV